MPYSVSPFLRAAIAWGVAAALAAGAPAALAQDGSDPAEGAAASGGSENIITAHGFSDLGELKYPADFDHLDYVNPDAPKGGEMSIWARGTFDSLNPYTRKGRAGALSSMPYERIMTSTADDAYASYCLLCETLEYPESQDWVIFHLREDVTFSDGTPMTAEDVAFTFRLFLEQGLPSFSSAVKKLIPEVEVLDEHTVKFHFNPDVPRKGLISQAGSAVVMSEDWFEETGARLDESRLEASPGTGPYMLDKYDINRSITYSRNPDYWGADLPMMKGQANFDTIRVEYFADSNAALEAFKAGAYTFRQETSSITWATAYDFPKIEDGTIIKDELKDGNLPFAGGMVFNLRKEKFQDPRVRRALGLMFNFTWTNDTLQYGLFKQRASFWQDSPLQAEGKPEGLELEMLQSVEDKIDPEILTEPVFTPHESGKSQLDRGNLRTALRLMREAGWEAGDDGLLRKDGKTLKLEFLQNNPSFDRIILPYIDNLKRLGVDASYNRIDDAQYTDRERNGDFDMIYDGFSNGLEEGLGLSQRYGCEDAMDSVFNPGAYCNEAVDVLIDKVIDAKSVDEMQAAVRAIDRIMRHDYFIVPAWYNDSYWVAYYDMYEHPEPLPPYSLGNLDFWWYNKDKADELRASGAL